jgi:hypothetical protein
LIARGTVAAGLNAADLTLGVAQLDRRLNRQAIPRLMPHSCCRSGQPERHRPRSELGTAEQPGDAS